MQRQVSAVPVKCEQVLAAVIFVAAVLAFSPKLAQAQEQEESAVQSDGRIQPLTGVTSSMQNPLQIAILHWYNANATTQVTTGTSPYGIAFDGANIWVANDGSNNVVKLQPSSGAVLGTFTVGTSPLAVAYDGANIWVANIGSNNVTKLNSSTGAVL